MFQRSNGSCLYNISITHLFIYLIYLFKASQHISWRSAEPGGPVALTTDTLNELDHSGSDKGN